MRTAPGPTRPIEKGLLGSNWLSSMVVERFGNHMPYHRLEQKYASEGLDLSRSVLCRSALDLAELFCPVYHAMRADLVFEDVLFADETGVTIQRAKKGPSRKAQLWLYANKHGDQVFDDNESRGRDSPVSVLAGFEGYLHDDGYIVYSACLDPGKVKHVACLAHVRRKFVEARSSDKRFADEAIAWIAKLYAVEKAARERGLDADGLRTLRQEQSAPILGAFHEWLCVRQSQVRPESPMGKAIGYALRRWEAVMRVLEDGRLELDNNRAERAVPKPAVGLENWMMIGNERARSLRCCHWWCGRREPQAPSPGAPRSVRRPLGSGRTEVAELYGRSPGLSAWFGAALSRNTLGWLARWGRAGSKSGSPGPGVRKVRSLAQRACHFASIAR